MVYIHGNITNEDHGVWYCNCNLMKGNPSIRHYSIINGTHTICCGAFSRGKLHKITCPDTVTRIESLAFRNCEFLKEFVLPKYLNYIGDASFSGCTSFKHLFLSASVNYIGVAAFCKSGLETVLFEGIPKEIEKGIFRCCEHLKQIVVPKGSKALFVERLGVPAALVVEGREIPKTQSIPSKQTETVDLFGKKEVKRAKFDYNQQSFNWSVGDSVDLRTFFSGPTPIVDNPAYLFRRRVLFIFLKTITAERLDRKKEYEIPAIVPVFTRKYQEKYGTYTPRVFVFVCDDGQKAKVYDEVKYLKTNSNSIIVKSLLRI